MSAHPSEDKIDWSLTTWEGSRLEQKRRWAALNLDQMLDAQEEMGDLAKEFGGCGMTTAEGGDGEATVRKETPTPPN